MWAFYEDVISHTGAFAPGNGGQVQLVYPMAGPPNDRLWVLWPLIKKSLLANNARWRANEEVGIATKSPHHNAGFVTGRPPWPIGQLRRPE